MEIKKPKTRIYNISNFESIAKNNLSFQLLYVENNFKHFEVLHYSKISTNEDFLNRIIEIIVIDPLDRATQQLDKSASIRLINLLTYNNTKNEKANY
jgi:hypothetical protein